MTVDALLIVAAKRGLRVNNLFQLQHGWRCNLLQPPVLHDFAEGATAAEALQRALDKFEDVGSVDDLL